MALAQQPEKRYRVAVCRAPDAMPAWLGLLSSSDLTGEIARPNDAGEAVMWSQLFVERYAREKHQAHLSEAAHDRLPRDLRAVGHSAQGRLLRMQPALVLAAAMVAVMVIAAGTRLVLLA